MSATPNILVAGIGNIFLGDDAFGCEVTRRLLQLEWPENVRVIDFGIRGLDLAYELLDHYDAIILIDALPRGGHPGSLYVFQPQINDDAMKSPVLMDAHSMDPEKVVRLVQSLGGKLEQLIVVGCEPMPFDPDKDFQPELSPPVRASVDRAVEFVLSLVKLATDGDSSFVDRVEAFTRA